MNILQKITQERANSFHEFSTKELEKIISTLLPLQVFHKFLRMTKLISLQN